jgi:hypothetical protein
MLRLIFAGLIAGVISPLLLSWLQHRVIWRTQKKADVKYAIFSDAVRALSQYSVDALDPALQVEKKSYHGQTRYIETRPETLALMEQSRSMVQAFFSERAYEAFNSALCTPISIETVPNFEFEGARVKAIVALATDLGIR